MAWGNKKDTQMSKIQETEQKSINIIGSGTKIEGDVSSSGDMRIDGTLEGNIDVKGKLVVGASGFIKGTIKCKNSDISGKIEGTINVAELLNIKASASINGEIFTKKLAIEPGAIFTGSCSMKESVSLGAKPNMESKTDVKKQTTK